ncbi:hypothetical protein ACNKHS_19275 [Shigella flexneri]
MRTAIHALTSTVRVLAMAQLATVAACCCKNRDRLLASWRKSAAGVTKDDAVYTLFLNQDPEGRRLTPHC